MATNFLQYIDNASAGPENPSLLERVLLAVFVGLMVGAAAASYLVLRDAQVL
jgi:hypothetical protein